MVYIQFERRALLVLCYWSPGTDLSVLTFHLLLDCEIVIFFLSFFRSFIFSFSNSIVFLDVFFASLPSFTHPCRPPPSRGNAHLFCFRPFVRLIVRCWLTRKVRAVLWSERICTDLHFSVPGMETLAVILNYRWQVKRLKVPFNSVWRENFFFSAKKKQQQQQQQKQ